MRLLALAGLACAVFAAGAARACEEDRIIECAVATYCAYESAADGEWVKYRGILGPTRTPRVPDVNEPVLVFVEVEGSFGTQRLYTLGSFGNCAWSFENDYVSRSKVGRRILSWKRLDEPQYTE